ncbi:MAG: HD domain-containing protein [Eubacteriales bacterium]|nr:HD domain-containing protein [Eubacteriales bacterium]
MLNEKTLLPLNDSFEIRDVNQYIKSFMFIKGFACAKNLVQTNVALSLSRRLHDGQYRKNGVPYILHPLKVCSTLISYGIDDDETLAAALLHDVLEDCQSKLPLHGKELITEYNISQEVFDIITVLTKESGLDQYELSVYFDRIRKNHKAALIKLADRLHNSSTLYAFDFVKMSKYIEETYTFLIPMASFCKNYYPEYTNAFSILKSNIYSLNHSMDVLMKKFHNEKERGSKGAVGK